MKKFLEAELKMQQIILKKGRADDFFLLMDFMRNIWPNDKHCRINKTLSISITQFLICVTEPSRHTDWNYQSLSKNYEVFSHFQRLNFILIQILIDRGLFVKGEYMKVQRFQQPWLGWAGYFVILIYIGYIISLVSS